jgi:uncharacterized protein with PIN domain
MIQVLVCFHAELNDFLPRAKRNAAISHTVAERTSAKDVIESLGVPHTEVAFLFANGQAIDFRYLIHDSDSIDVFSETQRHALPFSTCMELRTPPSRRFVLDTHLGRLAGYLRMLGFDTLYSNIYQDDELATISSTENRILLTRDIGLLKRSIVIHGYFVRSVHPQEQVTEVLQRFSFFECIDLFSRCMKCNGILYSVSKEEVFHQIEPLTRSFYEEFRQCQQCGKIYWQGSHYENMQRLIARIQSQ